MILYAKNIYCKVIFYGKNSLSYAEKLFSHAKSKMHTINN